MLSIANIMRVFITQSIYKSILSEDHRTDISPKCYEFVKNVKPPLERAKKESSCLCFSLTQTVVLWVSIDLKLGVKLVGENWKSLKADMLCKYVNNG